MNLPQNVNFSTLSGGDVALIPGNLHYIMKCDPTTYADLGNGAITTGVDPNAQVLPLPGAKLVLG